MGLLLYLPDDIDVSGQIAHFLQPFLFRVSLPVSTIQGGHLTWSGSQRIFGAQSDQPSCRRSPSSSRRTCSIRAGYEMKWIVLGGTRASSVPSRSRGVISLFFVRKANLNPLSS